ncbi:MAG: cell division ATP-binding protein FtsE [Gemmatimonadota bacterium]
MIRFDHVTREFPRGKALDDVSFRIRKGEFAFLTGHSGAGKTTALRMIHASDLPTAGEVRVNGYETKSLSSKDKALLRRKIGYVFQDFRLLPDRSAAENVAFALEVTGAKKSLVRTKVGRLLAQVGLAAKARSVPSELSGGEQQRVAVARALANDPVVLLADEPTGNLDERATRGIYDLFRTINAAGTAVVLATHDADLIRQSPGARLIELDHGALVYDSHAEAP